MKLLKLNNEELSNAITSGDTYIQIGNYEVTDPEEEMLLPDAMNADNPSLSKQEKLSYCEKYLAPPSKQSAYPYTGQ